MDLNNTNCNKIEPVFFFLLIFSLSFCSAQSYSAPEMAAAAAADDIIAEIPTYITVYKNGTVDRPRQTPFVRPSLHDPETGVSSKDIVISENPSISARLYLPKSAQSGEYTQNPKVPILVYFHGGGFFFESAFSELYHNYFVKFVSQIEVLVVSVEYRLAPEHYLPAAYEDCWAALQWVATHSTKRPTESEPWLVNHGDFERVFIGGDSAGGNIVHNIAMRSGEETRPCGVKLTGAIYAHPYFLSSKPIGSEPVEGFEKSLPYVVWGFVYPNAPGGVDNPMLNPVALGAPSLTKLGSSKILVCVAGKDNMKDRGVWYYKSVKNSEWKGELELFEQDGEDHVYHIFYPDSENGKMMMKRLASFIFEEKMEDLPSFVQ